MRAGTGAKAKRLTNPAEPSALVARLFGAGVMAAELRGEADEALLFPAEAASCAGFARTRLRDFTAGRLCARRALAGLGIREAPLEVNADRTPRWPPGVVGSISHTAGFCCAAAAFAASFGSIGLDVEIVGRVTANLHHLVFTERERAFLATLSNADGARAATILFSAKEAFYKCQYVVTRQWLDFADASLEIASSDLHTGSFTIETAYDRLELGAVADLPLRGRFVVADGFALCGITLRS